MSKFPTVGNLSATFIKFCAKIARIAGHNKRRLVWWQTWERPDAEIVTVLFAVFWTRINAGAANTILNCKDIGQESRFELMNAAMMP